MRSRKKRHSRPSTKFILSETNVLRINSNGNPCQSPFIPKNAVGSYFLIFRSCPIYRALLKTADESADYKKILPQTTKKWIQSHFSGYPLFIKGDNYLPLFVKRGDGGDFQLVLNPKFSWLLGPLFCLSFVIRQS